MSIDLPGASSTEWFARSEVEAFLEGAATRRSELEAAIADARSRIQRAEEALGLHEMMSSMLLDTQRELVDQRRAAEDQASAIIKAAEPRPQPVAADPTGLRADTEEDDPPSADHENGHAVHAPESHVPFRPRATNDREASPASSMPPEIDLAAFASSSTPAGLFAGLAAPRYQTNTLGGDNDRDGDGFMAFLRGSSSDQESSEPGVRT